jgi:EAL domain-containing protein (putative c-di-GMP-specific phosphodiesterase class I)/HAMP domain-containing protein
VLTFRNRLLILLIGLVVGAETVTLFTALASTRETVRQDADRQLRDYADLARRGLDNNESVLATAVKALTSDYGVREAVGSFDSATVASALANIAERIPGHATLALALELDGKLIARGENSAAVDPSLVAAIAADGEVSGRNARFLVAPQGVFQVFTSPVHAPDEIARIAIGFSVDDQLAHDLITQRGVEVAFLAGDGGERRVASTTLPALRQAGAAPGLQAGAGSVVLDIGGREYLAAATQLETHGAPLYIALFKPMDEVMQPYRELALNLGLIIGATLVAVVFAGIYLGRSAARPVQQLAAGAARVAAGDYSTGVVGSGGQELEHLADAFNSMQQGIADRESRLLHMARHDSTTGLPNRVFAGEWLDARIASMDARERIGIALVAVTNLQEISASLGFDITGKLVWHIARSLEYWSEQGGLVARIDATHFVVATRPAEDVDMGALVTHVRGLAQAPLTDAGITLQAATVLGAVLASRGEGSATELLRCAEAAVETAIQQRQPYAFFERASDELQRRRLQLGTDLPQALQSGQLYLRYQPKFRVSDRSPRGVEALLRWQHPVLGNVSPAEFIPIAERTGNSSLLTRWVLKEALAQLAAWQREGIFIEVAVNLSAADIVDPGMLEYILGALRDAKLATSALTLEITESVLLHEPEVARRNMEMLRIAGVRFSIDDFGTGYSSLSQLRELAADELKIDQSFVRVLGEGNGDVALVRAIIDLARGLGMRTVAEGVEHEAQWRTLAGLGCDYVQGYLLGKPQSDAELTPQLQAAVARDREVDAHTASLRVLELRRKE